MPLIKNPSDHPLPPNPASSHPLHPQGNFHHSAGDDVPRPGLMFCPRLEVGDGDLHCLDLLVFGRDGADFVAHLVSFHRHVLALDAASGLEKGFRMCSK